MTPDTQQAADVARTLPVPLDWLIEQVHFVKDTSTHGYWTDADETHMKTLESLRALAGTAQSGMACEEMHNHMEQQMTAPDKATAARLAKLLKPLLDELAICEEVHNWPDHARFSANLTFGVVREIRRTLAAPAQPAEVEEPKYAGIEKFIAGFHHDVPKVRK